MSSDIPPSRSGGMSRRSSLRGLSVTEYTAWAVTSAKPRGRQLRANICTQSKTRRMINATKNKQQSDIDEPENNSHELTHISMFIPDTEVSSGKLRFYFNTDNSARMPGRCPRLASVPNIRA